MPTEVYLPDPDALARETLVHMVRQLQQRLYTLPDRSIGIPTETINTDLGMDVNRIMTEHFLAPVATRKG